MNAQFLAATRIGLDPRGMQRAWDELRGEATDNYGFRAGIHDEEAREKLGSLAEPTPATIRNIGAVERKEPRGVQAFVEERSNTATEDTREEGKRGDSGDTHQQEEGGEEAEEDMDALMDAVARANSHAEREEAKTAGKER